MKEMRYFLEGKFNTKFLIKNIGDDQYKQGVPASVSLGEYD